MRREWRVVSLGDLFKVKHGFAFKGEYFTDQPQQTILVTPGNFAIDGGFQDQKRKFYRGPVPEDYVLKPGQIVVTMTDLSKQSDTLGHAASIPRDSNIWLHNQRVGLLVFNPDFPSVPRFIEYLLRSREYRAWVVGSATGTTVKHTSPGRIESYRTQVPALSEQRAIASILGALDDKIDLNPRMNETLEAMARALFKDWFVDFGPTRAKMEGREPYLAPDLWALFPNQLDDEGKPEGWALGPLSQFFDLGLGGAWGNSEFSEKTSISAQCLRGIDCHELAEGRIPSIPIRWLSQKQVFDRKLSAGTLLIEGSGSFCGRSLLWHVRYGDLVGEPVVYSNFCKRLDPLCTAAQAAVCWYSIRRSYDSGSFKGFRTGTAFPNFDIHGALANEWVTVPFQSIAEHFHELCSFDKRIQLIKESRTLAQTRDLLLPKLISGEIRVRDAERMVEEVA